MFALWDASKYGHIGSFEWVQVNNLLCKKISLVMFINKYGICEFKMYDFSEGHIIHIR
jgi:hypothetical protein